MFKWQVVGAVGCVLLPFGVSEAHACDPSGWQISGGGGECLEIGRDDHDELIVENACAEPIEVSVAECTGTCPPDMHLSPGEERPLNLQVEAAADDGFRLISSRDDPITFVYVVNPCPSEKGCSLAAGASASGGWLATLLGGAWVLRRRRSPRG